MLTQNPTLRATTLLKDATKPIRVYLGYRGSEKRLIAALALKEVVIGLPWTVLTVDPAKTTESQLADLIASNWLRLADEYAQRRATPTSIPTPRHVWRTAQRTATR